MGIALTLWLSWGLFFSRPAASASTRSHGVTRPARA
jgi:hypothetical protein